jgi:hypothetical protein
MAVVLTISETLDGAQVADALATPGPANTGVDFGSVTNGAYAPITVKADNTGRKDLFIRHNAVVDPITSVKTFIQTYGTGTGFGYAGADSAANDFNNKLKALGNTSGSSKNNADGNSGGLWLDMNAILLDTTGSTQFDFDTNGYDSVGLSQGGDDTVRIYGDNLVDGISLASAFNMHTKAMVIDSDQSLGGSGVNGYVPTAPVTGQIGKNGDTAKGDNAHVKLRIYVRNDTVDGGIVQWEWVCSYSYTAALLAAIAPTLMELVSSFSWII